MNLRPYEVTQVLQEEGTADGQVLEATLMYHMTWIQRLKQAEAKLQAADYHYHMKVSLGGAEDEDLHDHIVTLQELTDRALDRARESCWN